MPEPNGDYVPYELMGWLGPEVAEPEFERLAQNFIPFEVYGVDKPTRPGPPVWECAKRINGGQHLPTWKQLTGDCVAVGATQAGQYLSAFEIYRLGQEAAFKFWFPPFIYGTSRVQVGNRRIRGAGSTGSWAATAMMKYGVLFMDDEGVPQYSKEIADSWGDTGPAQRFLDLAKDNLVGSAARLRTVEDIREALLNYKMVTVASGRGFNMQPVNYRGYHVFKPQGQWPHQMTFLSWMDEPFAAAYRLNSWGNAHGQPLNGEPPGGAWNLASDIEKELKQYGVELYALSMFQGFPAVPNFSLV